MPETPTVNGSHVATAPKHIPVCWNDKEKKYNILLDASAFSRSECFLRLVLTTHFGYNAVASSEKIIQGAAFHKFFEVYHKNNKDYILAMEKASQLHIAAGGDKFEEMTYEHLTKACLLYHTRYSKILEDRVTFLHDPDKKRPLQEMKFAIPVYQDDLMNILVAGTIDSVCVDKDSGNYPDRPVSALLVGDVKTTSKQDTASFFYSFTASVQLMLYIWALKWHIGKYPQGFLARMVDKKTTYGAFILGGFFSTAKDKDAAKFALSPSIYTYDGDTMMNEMLICMGETVGHLVSFVNSYHAHTGEFPFRPVKYGIFNGACHAWDVYGKCPFIRACFLQKEEDMWDALNSGYYTKKYYDPREFGGGVSSD